VPRGRRARLGRRAERVLLGGLMAVIARLFERKLVRMRRR
jgi:hypothetical protein